MLSGAIDFLVSKGKVKAIDKVSDNNRKVSVIFKGLTALRRFYDIKASNKSSSGSFTILDF